jgi:hypothetical protein
MSAPSEPTTAETVDRSVDATRKLCDELALGVLKPKDLKLYQLRSWKQPQLKLHTTPRFATVFSRLIGT